MVVVCRRGARHHPRDHGGGLPLGRRIALAGTRAGRLRARPRSPAAAGVILVPSNVIPQPRWLRALAAMPLEPETLWVDPAQVAVVDTDDPEAGARRRRPRGERGRVRRHPARAGSTVVEEPRNHKAASPVRTAGDLRRAESWLLRGLIKDTEGVHVAPRRSG